MCAIIGVLGNNLPSQEQFIKARDTMTHRGPDDAGLYYMPKEGVALGHRRLSIIDLSSEGRQPLFSHDGRYAIVFNGEIYNYKELKQELKNHYPFKTQTDTEVLLAAYITWGAQCLQKLNGMFAFAIWDKNKRELFCARDRLGVKPFYYTTQGGNFYFSSEIKGILVMSDADRVLNKESFLDFLSYRYPLGEKTMFKDIFSLLPGHYIVATPEKVSKPISYWSIPVHFDKKDSGEDEVKERTKDLLLSSVAYRMISDVPVGTYLSGGLDSSLITAMMASLSKKPVKTFSVGFEDEGFNEFEYARKVAKLFNTEHHEVLLDGRTYLNAVQETIQCKDAPLAVPFEVSGVLLSKELKKHITVVLAGEGADELFGGYGRIFRSGHDFEKTRHSSGGTFVDHFLSRYSYISKDEKQMLISDTVKEEFGDDILNKEFFNEIFDTVRQLPFEEQAMYVFERVHLLGLLHRLDNSAMAKSVEAREPFVDYRLVEYVSGLPVSYKMRWKSKKDKKRAQALSGDQISETYDIPKYLLKEIAKDYLPDEIIYRKKLGPPAPLNQWFRGEFRNHAKGLLLGDSKIKTLFNTMALEQFLEGTPQNPNDRRGLNVWMLTTLELWMREYNVSL